MPGLHSKELENLLRAQPDWGKREEERLTGRCSACPSHTPQKKGEMPVLRLACPGVSLSRDSWLSSSIPVVS